MLAVPPLSATRQANGRSHSACPFVQRPDRQTDGRMADMAGCDHDRQCNQLEQWGGHSEQQIACTTADITHRHTHACVRTTHGLSASSFSIRTQPQPLHRRPMQSEPCLTCNFLSPHPVVSVRPTPPLHSLPTSLPPSRPPPQPAATMDELTEKMSEARGMLSNLIFGKKQKKPRELVRPSMMHTRGGAGLRLSRSIDQRSAHRDLLSAASASAVALV